MEFSLIKDGKCVLKVNENIASYCQIRKVFSVEDTIEILDNIIPESVKLSKKAAIFIKYHAPDCSNNKPIRLQGFYC